MDRLPDSPRLQLLGPGLTNIASESYRRHSELVHTTFAQLDWSAHEFVGFRCEEEYPIWGSGYCMTFDYSNPDRK